MSYTITIKNRYQPSTRRRYCVVAQPPVVKDEGDITIHPGDQGGSLMTPIFALTDTIPLDAVTSVTFKYEYFAFVGTLKVSDGRTKIGRSKSKRVTVGSANENGSVAIVNWDDGVDIRLADDKDLEDHGLKLASKDTFQIKCTRPPSGPNIRQKYVVGLAQRLVADDEEEGDQQGEEEGPDPVPIAAVAFEAGKLYTFRPSAMMAVSAIDSATPKGQVFRAELSVTPVDFSSVRKSDHPEIVLTDAGGHFLRATTPVPAKTLRTLGMSSSSSAPPRAAHQQQQQPRRAANAPPKWKEEADKLGFTFKRQLNAYKFLTKYNKTQLAGFHNDDVLKNIARNAKDWGDKIHAKDGYSDEYLDDLLVFALFDTILYLDNSTSIDWEPERSEQLQDISGSIVDVENIYDNTQSVRIEFLNGPPREEKATTAEQARELISNIRNFGMTPLGTELRRKILDRFVYPKLESKGTFRPVLICVITDGDPQGEDRDKFKSEIQECKRRLAARDKTKVGDKHVLFQISRVGNDSGAIKFIQSLRADPELKNILHITSYQHLDFSDDQNDPIFTYSAAISRLAGAAFVGLSRNAEGEFVFPQT